MKLTRRKIIFLTTALAIADFKNTLRLVRAQSTDSLKNLNEEQLYNNFLKLAAGGYEDRPALLYQGINSSPYQAEIQYYPVRLMQKPDGKNLVNAARQNNGFEAYPAVGKIPKIDEQGLKFLHSDIKEACICVGSFSTEKFTAKWLGRNALQIGEFWSGSKIIPIIHLISELSHKNERVNIDNYKIEGLTTDGVEKSFLFYDLVKDLISYEKRIASSNSLGAMFKRFYPQLKLENWAKSITGNKNLIFRGRYGEEPFIDQPKIINNNKVIISSDSDAPKGGINQISAYDLARILSMVGWHNYLPTNAQFPGVNWNDLKNFVTVLGTDPARLTDLAIKALGLEDSLNSVVILSKEGDGATASRERTEAVYVALVQCCDRRPQKLGKPAQLMTLTMALRGARAHSPRNFDREVVELDARMATAVTQIIDRAIKGVLA